MANPYTLTREMADKIVAAVRSDPQSRKLLTGTTAFRFFAPIGHAGTARNLTNAFAFGLARIDSVFQTEAAGRRTRAYWSDKGDAEACTAVGATTARVLNKVARQPGFEFLLEASALDRLPSDPMNDFHTATQVTVAPGKSYVFDWHATLSLECPLIFPSPVAFKAGRPVVKYLHFWGWS
jgi:hypothetical protein